MNKAVKLKPLDGTIIKAKRCKSPYHAILVARQWSAAAGLAYSMTGVEITIFRRGSPVNETNALKMFGNVNP